MKSRTITPILVAVFATFILPDAASAYYSPRMGRFLNRDPIDEPGAVLIRTTATDETPSHSFLSRDPITDYEQTEQHLFRYAQNAAINNVDPLGLQTSPTNWCTKENDRGCCDCLVYSEAGGAGSACQRAVTHVLKNRQKTDWPDFKNEKSFCAQADAAAWDGGTKGKGKDRYNNCCRCRDGLNPAEYEAMISAAAACNAAVNGQDPTGGAQYTFRAGATPPWMKEQKRRGNCGKVSVPGCTQKEFWKCKKRPLK